MKSYKHIIWDWNGTLLDDITISLNAVNSILIKRKKKPITLNFHKNNFLFPIKDYYKKLSLSTDDQSFNILCDEFNHYYIKHWKKTKLQKNALQVLKKIHSSTINQSILSAQENNQLNRFIDFYNIRKYFNNIIGLNNKKAEGKIEKGKQLLSELNLSNENILLIGDTNYDYSIARKLKIDCILFNGGHQSEKILSKACNKVIFSLETILKILKI